MARFSLTHKVLAVYLAVAIFFSLASLYSLNSFRRLHASLSADLSVKLDILLSLQQLKSTLARLEQVGQAYLEGGAEGSLEIFQSRRDEFARIFDHVSHLIGDGPAIRDVADGFQRYLDSFAQERNRETRSAGMAAVPHGGTRIDIQVRSLTSSLDALLGRTRTELEARFSSADGLSQRAFAVTLYLMVFGLMAGLAPPLLIAMHFKTSLKKLGKATQMIAEGSFDYDPRVQSSDEIGELAQGLKSMAQKLKNYEQICLDASPLTRLPGNIAIERALLEKIRRNEKFALCYADLDDFKAYNDIYGYAKGSEIIKVTGEIIHEAKRQYGRTDDFVGHIGGDDFVLITAPENASGICEHIIQEFDRVIPYFYVQEDRERGFLESVDRYGVARQFPLMTISIAVVSDVSRDLLSPTEIAQVAAEIKEFVKILPGSNYLVDRRQGVRSTPATREE